MSLCGDVKKLRRYLPACLFLLLAFASVAFAQASKVEPKPSKQADDAAKPAKTRPAYSLQVTNKDIVGVSLTAEKVTLPKIAADLSSKLKIPVVVGAGAKSHEVTADFKDLTLEPALHLLAPQAFVDYEVNSAPGAQPRPIGIYLNAYDDPEPAISALVPAKTEAILIEGNTEEEPLAIDTDAPTRVVYEANSLTVSARRQPLSVVLYKIAYEMHIPFELKWETSELVDVNIEKLPLEEAMPRLSPHVRLFVRANLQRFERKPFRMVLVRPSDGT